jgi:hypothetical protein
MGYPISNNPPDWILADAFDNEPGRLLTNAYHMQYPLQPGPEFLAKDWENKTFDFIGSQASHDTFFFKLFFISFITLHSHI